MPVPFQRKKYHLFWDVLVRMKEKNNDAYCVALLSKEKNLNKEIRKKSFEADRRRRWKKNSALRVWWLMNAFRFRLSNIFSEPISRTRSVRSRASSRIDEITIGGFITHSNILPSSPLISSYSHRFTSSLSAPSYNFASSKVSEKEKSNLNK